jgi:VIT1/CCC1 family predicted Fe2+/Mn2+ transporter
MHLHVRSAVPLVHTGTMTASARPAPLGRLARPAVFGLADGLMSMLGVVLYLSGHANLVFPAALSGGISSALSMAGSEWLSDSDNGLGASLVMGSATGLGAIAPAIPYAVSTGPAAVAESVIICVLIGVCVSALRPMRGFGMALAETFGILAAIFAVVLACGLMLPGGAA